MDKNQNHKAQFSTKMEQHHHPYFGIDPTFLDLNKNVKLNKAHFQIVSETAIDAIISINRQGKMIFQNLATERMFGYSLNELTDKSLEVLIPERFREAHRSGVKRIAQGGEIKLIGKTVELSGLRKDGSEFPIELSLSKYNTDEGVFFTGIIRDISERKRTETERDNLLNILGERLKELSCMYGVTQAIGRNQTIDEIFREIITVIPLGWHYPEITCCRIRLDDIEYLSYPFKETEWCQRADLYVENGLNGTIEVFYIEECPDLDEGPFLKEERDLINGIARTLSQAINRINADRNLKASELKFRNIIEQSNDAIYIILNNRFDLINPRFTELTGITYEETQDPDFDFMNTLTEESKAIVQDRSDMRARGVKPPSVYEFALLHKNGKEYRVQASISEIEYMNGEAILGFLTNMNEKKELEDQLRQIQKIESIGHLAGGIAHDFNNLLTPIIGNTELMMMDLNSANPLYNDLGEINETALRASELTRQLLAFSRKQVLEMKTVDLNELIKNFWKIIRRTIREDINIEVNYCLTPCMVRVDISQIEQILMNLLVNAQDAMRDGGVITIKTDSVELDQEYANSRPGVLPGHYVKLTVSDTGEGMNQEIKQKVFDPFFTTKEVGKGTGLGLSTVYGIVKQHGGNIWVNSKPNIGTVFTLYLPLGTNESIIKVDPKNNGNNYTGTGNILIVEDQEQVRLIASRILQTKGYTVHVASNELESIEIIKDKSIAIDLLLSDVIMPDMNGRELYTQLNKIRPGLKVLYMSGYTQDVIGHHGVLEDGINFIQKPLSVEGLAKKVKEVLNN